MTIHKLICVLVQLLQHNLLFGWKTFFSVVFYAKWVVFQTQSFYSGFCVGLLVPSKPKWSFFFSFFFHSHLIFIFYFVYFMFPLQIIIFHLCVSKGKIPEDAVHWGCLIVFCVCLACNDVMSSFSFALSCLFDSFLDWNVLPSFSMFSVFCSMGSLEHSLHGMFTQDPEYWPTLTLFTSL